MHDDVMRRLKRYTQIGIVVGAVLFATSGAFVHGADFNQTHPAFDPSRQYTGVQTQPGRVQQDQDWNDQQDGRRVKRPCDGAAGEAPRSDNSKHYARTPMQQGKVQRDQDWNPCATRTPRTPK